MNSPPRMMSIRSVAATGLLPEHALRVLEKQGRLPALYIGKKCLINYEALVAQLNELGNSNSGICGTA